jgi:hypothetical protein
MTREARGEVKPPSVRVASRLFANATGNRRVPPGASSAAAWLTAVDEGQGAL